MSHSNHLFCYLNIIFWSSLCLKLSYIVTLATQPARYISFAKREFVSGHDFLKEHPTIEIDIRECVPTAVEKETFEQGLVDPIVGLS